MSDDTNKEFDPTESVRTLTSAPFKESFMSLREHQDTDRHYIGDSLPVPSLSQMKNTGNNSEVGVLPFPARVDHVHELRMTWGYFNSPNKVIPPGRTYINNLQFTGWGKNMLTTGQILAFPYNGTYSIKMNFAISRVGLGLFEHEMNIGVTVNNGGANKILQRYSMFDIPDYFYCVTEDVQLATAAPSVNDNIQFFIEHNDTVNWNVAMQHLVVFRLTGHASN